MIKHKNNYRICQYLGGSILVNLPASICSDMGIVKETVVVIGMEDNKIIIEKVE